MTKAIQKLLSIFILICFQTQAVSVMVLPCKHSTADRVAAGSAGCHSSPLGVMDTSDKSAPKGTGLDCQKCQLGCSCGGYSVLPVVSYGLGSSPQSGTPPLSGRHFYRFVPDLPQRPPNPDRV